MHFRYSRFPIQMQTNTARLHLHKVPRIVKFIESESMLADARGKGVEAGELVFDGDSFSLAR